MLSAARHTIARPDSPLISLIQDQQSQLSVGFQVPSRAFNSDDSEGTRALYSKLSSSSRNHYPEQDPEFLKVRDA